MAHAEGACWDTPAEKMIGGRMKLKNTSLSKWRNVTPLPRDGLAPSSPAKEPSWCTRDQNHSA